MTYRFCTIGHSTRSLDEFISLLRVGGVRLVIDVRAMPRSRTNPQFNGDELGASLNGIGYEHIAELGGLRGRSRDVPGEVNAFWQNRSFHNYADYAMSEEFRSGLAKLRSLGHATPCVIMCAEAVWWRCHRWIVTDYLIAGGDVVFHILDENHVGRAVLTSAANIEPGGVLTYPNEGDMP